MGRNAVILGSRRMSLPFLLCKVLYFYVRTVRNAFFFVRFFFLYFRFSLKKVWKPKGSLSNNNKKKKVWFLKSHLLLKKKKFHWRNLISTICLAGSFGAPSDSSDFCRPTGAGCTTTLFASGKSHRSNHCCCCLQGLMFISPLSVSPLFCSLTF